MKSFSSELSLEEIDIKKFWEREVESSDYGKKKEFLLGLDSRERIWLYTYYYLFLKKAKKPNHDQGILFASSVIHAYRKYGENPEFYKRKQAIKEQYGIGN